MTATSAVSPGRSASPGCSGSRPNPIAGALVASLAPGMLTTAKIAMLIGVAEVHHDCCC